MRDYAQRAQVLDDGVRQLGRLDVFFANAGIFIVTSSTTGLKAYPSTTASTASKHGVIAVDRTVRCQRRRQLPRFG